MPRVTVVIPTYNRASLLPRAIRSVLAQTFSDFELLIVDDASSDNTEEVVAGFAGPQISHIRRQRNRGLAAARNTGIAAARGEFIAFLDDDDEWLPRKLETQVAIFDAAPARVGAVHCGSVTIVSETGKTVVRLRPTCRGNLYPRLRYFPNFLSIGGSTLMFRRGCFGRVGLFDEQFVVHQQYEMWFRVAREFEFESTPEVLVRCYLHGEASHISDNLPRRIDATEKFVAKHFEELRKYPKDLRRHYLRIGMMCTHAGQPRAGREWLARSMRLGFFQPKAWLYCACSLAPALYESTLGSSWYKIVSKARRSVFGIYG